MKLLLMKRSAALDKEIFVQAAYSHWKSTFRKDGNLIHGHLSNISKHKVTISLAQRKLLGLQCIKIWHRSFTFNSNKSPT
jgi:hypothetical protein